MKQVKTLNLKKLLVAALSGMAMSAGLVYAGGPTPCQQCEISFEACTTNATTAAERNRCRQIFVNCARANSCAI
jgi:hypothetical protein